MYSVGKTDSRFMDLPGRFVNVFIGAGKVDSRRLTVGLTEVHPKTAMKSHAHDEMEEVIFVTEGHGVVDVGGSIEKLEPNTAVLFPAGVPHIVTNQGDEPLRFVFIFNPPNDFSSIK